MKNFLPAYVLDAARTDNDRRRPYDVSDLWDDLVGGRPSDFHDCAELSDYLRTTKATPEDIDALLGYWCEES